MVPAFPASTGLVRRRPPRWVLGFLGHLLALLILGGVPQISRGATITWDGAGANALWDTVTNWSGNALPANGDTVQFGSAFTSGTFINLNGNRTANTLLISTLTGFSITNSTLTLSSGDITRSDIAGTEADHTISSAIVLGADGAWTIDGSGSLTLSGIISGAHKGNKLGAGTLLLSGANTFSGDMTLTAGTLGLGHNTAAGTGKLILNGGTVRADGAAHTLANVLTLGGDFTIGGALDLILTGDATLSANRIITVDNTGNTKFSGILSGSKTLDKNGTGTLELSGTSANTFSQTFTVNAGTVLLNKTAGLNAYAATLVVGDGTGGANADIVRHLANNQMPATAVTINSSGWLDLNNFSDTIGALTMNGGTVSSGTGTLTTAVDITANASATLALISGKLAMSGNRYFSVYDGSLATDMEISANISGSGWLDKYYAGRLLLSASNSFTGIMYVEYGYLRINNSYALGTTASGTEIYNAGCALELLGGISIGAETLLLQGTGPAGNGALINVSDTNSWAGTITLTAAGMIGSDAGRLTLGAGGIVNGGFAVTFAGAADTTVSGIVSGTGALTKQGTGTLRLSGANTYSGNNTLSAGTLLLNNTSGSGAGTKPIAVPAGAILGGTGTMSGAVTNSGALSAGDGGPGTFASGAQTWNGGATNLWEINQANGTKGADPGWDFINITGALTITATTNSRFVLKVTSLDLTDTAGLTANFTNLMNYTWTMATASGGISGFATNKFTIDTSAFQNALAGGTFSLTNSGNNLNLVYTPPPNTDVKTTVTGPTSQLGFSSLAYTLTVTNQGSVTATNVIVKDTLPATATFVSASSGGSYSGGVVTWPTITAFAAAATTNFTVTITLPASGTLTNMVSSTATTADPTPSNNDGTAAASQVLTVVLGVNISGYAYLDANKNSLKDASEAGSGLTLYAKYFATTNASGPALAAATVDPTTGLYTLTNVYRGAYTIILDNNATLSDVTPTLPAGWSGTEMPAQTRTLAVGGTTDLNNQNFGLVNAITLSGKVFVDNGAGGGTANDGISNGAEAGKQGVVVKLTDNSGATTHDTATTDGAGNYSLLVPSTLTTGTILKVVEVNATGFLSTGAGVGNTGGTYDRTTDTVTFTLTSGTVYTAVNFGDVPVNTFVGDSQQNGSAGSFVLHAHAFTAGSAGTVAFSVTNSPRPVIAGWSQVIFLDANGNGQLDAGDTLLTAAIAVNAGDKVSILVRDFIPGGTPYNAQDQLTVTALFTYTGASPALTATATRTDLTTAGRAAGATLALLKAADRSTALPGETITYTVTYANRSAETLGSIVIADEVPAFTTFVSANASALPTGLTGVTISAPSVGATGPVKWTFAGSLTPGASGSVSFAVTLGQ